MKDYQLSKIYKLVSPSNPELVYFGSTTDKYLSNRMSKHRYEYRKQRKYYTAWDLLKFDDCKIVLVEACPCNNSDELNQREYYYISNNPCVNKIVTGRSDKEYYEDNKEKIIARAKKFYHDKKNINILE